MDINTYSTWLEIDLKAIKNNTALIREITGAEVMAVIKANGYGHGARPAAQAAVAGGATWIGVARIEEALSLRRAGIACKILVLGFTPAAKIPEVIENNITIALFDPELAQNYLDYVNIHGGTLHAHVKVETGMGRLGMRPDHVAAFIEQLKGTGIEVDGIFTHLARADEPNLDSTPRQLVAFNKLLTDLESKGLKPGNVHAANSAAVLNFPEANYDIVRPGDLLFGMSVRAAVERDSQLQPRRCAQVGTDAFRNLWRGQLLHRAAGSRTAG